MQLLGGSSNIRGLGGGFHATRPSHDALIRILQVSFVANEETAEGYAVLSWATAAGGAQLTHQLQTDSPVVCFARVRPMVKDTTRSFIRVVRVIVCRRWRRLCWVCGEGWGVEGAKW